MGLRKLLRVARWEVTKNAGGVDKRTIAVAALAIALIGVFAPVVAGQGAVLDDGLYRVSISEDSPYYDAVADDETFVVRPDATSADLGNSVELVVDGREVVWADSPKGRAAMEELRSTVQRYNTEQLRQEPNQSAAFPVSVSLEYRDQSNVGSSYSVDTSGSGQQDDTTGGNDTDGSTGDSSTVDGTPDDSTTDDGTDTGTNDGGTTGPGGNGTGSSTGAVDGDPTNSGGGLGGFGSSLSGDSTSVDSPSQLSPPFPFGSLVLAFVFIVPLNFLIQAYGSTILSERLNRRGELLLVSPVSRFDIIGGKTLPYFGAAMAIEALIAVGVTYISTETLGGLVSIAAIVPLVLLFLAATFLGAMFARSFKELTFVTVTITVGLTSYAFVPAIFTDVTPIALISPLTVVVRDLQGQAVGLSQFLFSVTPPLLSALVLFGLGAGLYREEDMFAQRSIPLKVLDALAGRIRKARDVAVVVAILLPFVFVLQLLAIAVLFALGEISIPLILVVVAVVEEVAKSLPIYAAYAHKRFEPTTRTALVLGLMSGVGFFVGEKLTHVAQLVGLPELEIGQAALQITPGDVGIPILLGLFFLPLVLHTVTAAISAVGASRGRRSYAVALGLAMVVHFAYNFVVVMSLV
ncbi:PrsW family intramembrane metalloprotease [Salinibaculum salinum]|uniref:PrsW family intramembrane metalloprotease n=1 Tax=Salinibaculum salinum TaxID=3131996 RepID=UPI0030ED0164